MVDINKDDVAIGLKEALALVYPQKDEKAAAQYAELYGSFVCKLAQFINKSEASEELDSRATQMAALSYMTVSDLSNDLLPWRMYRMMLEPKAEQTQKAKLYNVYGRGKNGFSFRHKEKFEDINVVPEPLEIQKLHQLAEIDAYEVVEWNTISGILQMAVPYIDVWQVLWQIPTEYVTKARAFMVVPVQDPLLEMFDEVRRLHHFKVILFDDKGLPQSLKSVNGDYIFKNKKSHA